MRYHLKEWRTLRELSQVELARKAHVARPTIAEIETEPEKLRQAKTIGKLARALEIKPSQLEREPENVPPVEKEIDDMTDEELLKQLVSVRFRGDLTQEQIESSITGIMRDVLRELRERGKR